MSSHSGSCHGIPNFLPESLTASGRSAEKVNLLALQSKMKCDPEGYESELIQLTRHFDSSLHLFQQQASLSLTSIGGDPIVAKELGDMAMFLSHVAPFYPDHLSDFPKKVSGLLRSAGRSLPSSLRCHLAQALILLINRQMVDIGENLALFMELQTLGDRNLQKLCFSHVVHGIRRMNQKHKNEAKNRALQNILFSMLQEEDELKAKRALVVLCDLHRRRVWFDDRTANAICTACFHSSSRVMKSTLSFLLGYERNEEANDSDDSSAEDDVTPQKAQVIISREAMYKAHHKGTSASKKKKQAKLQRAVRTMKKQQRESSEKNISSYYSPLSHLIDAQGFAEKLLSRFKTCNERFEVRMMMLKVVGRTIGLHRLVLLNFYTDIQKYIKPRQSEITDLLATAVQACHDMVPPEAVEELFKQVVREFIHDGAQAEALAVGLNVVREICLRMPLLMTDTLLQDLVMYRKKQGKAVSTAARSLLLLFREICPSLLVKKDRGRPADPKAKPKAFGEVHVYDNVPGMELLEQYYNENIDKNELAFSISDNDENAATDDDEQSVDAAANSVNGEESNEIEDELCGESSEDEEIDEVEEEESDDISDVDSSDNDESDIADEEDGVEHLVSDEMDDKKDKGENKTRKRKFFSEGQLSAADRSLGALKKLATKMDKSLCEDGILSNEDFQRKRELEEKQQARLILARHGFRSKGSDPSQATFKIPNSEQLRVKRVDSATLEKNIKVKLTKEQKLACIKAEREERGKYQARTAVKQKKTGGSSNKQKEHQKKMPMAAKRGKIARSRIEKKKQAKRASKQFRGKKAWK